MNRKLTLFICASFILLFCFPSASTAAERREEIIRFDNDAPASIRFILDESGYQNVSIIHGAAIIREHYDERGMQLDWSMAALIIEQSGHRQFLGMQWVIGTKNVVIETNDMVGVDLDSIFMVEPIVEGAPPIHERFGIRQMDGSSYEVIAAFGSSWDLYRYNSANGESIRLLNGMFDFAGEQHYALTTGWLKDPTAILSFPKSYAEARDRAAQSWKGVLEGGRALIWGANLRTDSTSSSRSLGKYTVTLAEIKDQKPGKTHPWYHVKIGETTGWVSGAYVSFSNDRKDFAQHASLGVEYATTLKPTTLYLHLNSNEVIQQLSQDVQMQVLASTEDGWLHVLVTNGGLNLQLDAEGVYGYVRSEDVKWTKRREI